MLLAQPVRELAIYLKNNPTIRSQIRAAQNKTLLYAGANFKACWKEIEEATHTNDQVADKETLPEVLKRIALKGAPHATLFQWLDAIDKVAPWQQNGFLAWRLASGLFASNASGAVSFWLGRWDPTDKKVFAVTELPVLRRNKNLDELTRDLLEYYERCIQRKRPEELVSFLAA